MCTPLAGRPVDQRPHDRQHEGAGDGRGAGEVERQRAGGQVQAEQVDGLVAGVVGGAAAAGRAPGDGDHERREQHAQDGRVVRGVGPVVPVPGLLLLRAPQRLEVGDALPHQSSSALSTADAAIAATRCDRGAGVESRGELLGEPRARTSLRPDAVPANRRSCSADVASAPLGLALEGAEPLELAELGQHVLHPARAPGPGSARPPGRGHRPRSPTSRRSSVSLGVARPVLCRARRTKRSSGAS